MVHDSLNRALQACFDSYFETLNEVHKMGTKSSKLGCLYTPPVSSTKYGLNSIKRKCINTWNKLTKNLNCNLSKLSRSMLKNKITKYYIDSY